MRTKLIAARIAANFGCATLITSGHDVHPIRRLTDGGRATIVAAKGSPASAYKQWIAGALAPAGQVSIDRGARAALASGKSLLPAGVTAVAGNFERGVCLSILDDEGREIARGITAYSAVESQAILGCNSDMIVERLGYSGPDELIHRDDMVML